MKYCTSTLYHTYTLDEIMVDAKAILSNREAVGHFGSSFMDRVMQSSEGNDGPDRRPTTHRFPPPFRSVSSFHSSASCPFSLSFAVYIAVAAPSAPVRSAVQERRQLHFTARKQ